MPIAGVPLSAALKKEPSLVSLASVPGASHSVLGSTLVGSQDQGLLQSCLALERVSLVGLLPGEFGLVSPEVSISGSFLEDRPSQVEAVHYTSGSEREMTANQ